MAKATSPNSAALEAALPTLTKKLKQMQQTMSRDELAIFSSIVNSAAMQLKSAAAIEDDVAEVRYAKPISAVATTAVRNQILRLPKTLGLNK
jgi:hypothetical protein